MVYPFIVEKKSLVTDCEFDGRIRLGKIHLLLTHMM